MHWLVNILVLSCLIASLQGLVRRGDPVPRVIYNGDTRLDNYQVSAALQELGRSVVEIVYDGTASISENNPSPGLVTITSTMPSGSAFQLCPNEPFSQQPVISGSSFCSGFLISADPPLVATARHCVDTFGPSSDVLIVFDWQNLDAQTTKRVYNSDDVYTVSSVLSFGAGSSDATDWGVFQLDRPVVGRTPYTAVNQNPAVNSGITLIGHPFGLPKKFDSDGTLTATGSTYRGFIDSYGGNSGSPVFDNAGNLVGILVAGVQDFVYDNDGNCYYSNNCPGGPGCNNLGETLVPICTMGSDPSLAGLNLCGITRTPSPSVTTTRSAGSTSTATLSASLSPAATKTASVTPSPTTTRTASPSPNFGEPSPTPTRTQNRVPTDSSTRSAEPTQTPTRTRNSVVTNSSTPSQVNRQSETPTRSPAQESVSSTVSAEPTRGSNSRTPSPASRSRTPSRGETSSRTPNSTRSRTPDNNQPSQTRTPGNNEPTQTRTPANNEPSASRSASPTARSNSDVPPGTNAVQFIGEIQCDPCDGSEFDGIEKEIAAYLGIPVSDVQIVATINNDKGHAAARLTVCADRDTIQKLMDGFQSGEFSIGFTTDQTASLTGTQFLGLCPINDVDVIESSTTLNYLSSDASAVVVSSVLLGLTLCLLL